MVRLFVVFFNVFCCCLSSTCGPEHNEVSSCIKCGRIQVTCNMTNLTQSLALITCEDSADLCTPTSFDVSQNQDGCYFSLQLISGDSWRQNAGSLEIPSTECNQSCNTAFTVNSHQDIDKLQCYCRDQDDCNDVLINGTVTINIQSQSDAIVSIDATSIPNEHVTSVLVSSMIITSSQTANHSDDTVLVSTPVFTSNHVTQLTQDTSAKHSTINSVTTIVTTNTTVNISSSNSTEVFVSVIIVLVVIIVLTIATVLLCACFSVYRKHSSKKSQHSIRHNIHTSPLPVCDADQSSEIFPLVIIDNIGHGKFGTVCRATFEGVPVAVKIFTSNYRNSWNNERYIYDLQSTSHENILYCICFEQRGNGPRKQLYRITEYHALGSLSRFLQHNKLNWNQALRAIHSVSCGLAHLHSNSYINREGSVQEKLAIAHRDVKSANVLVKDTSGHCVLGDLGLGIILDPTNMDDKRMARTEQV